MIPTKAAAARNRILMTATQHFAAKGFHGASLREITAAAKVNLAAVNYHFQNKAALYCEVLSSILNPLNKLRLQHLEDAQRLAGDRPVPLSLVFEIFAEPLFELSQHPNHANSELAKLAGRSTLEPLPFIQAFLTANQQVLMARLAQAIRRQATRITASEFMWRLSFLMGALHHTLATLHNMRELTHGLCPNNDSEQTLEHFVRFAVNTIQSPEGTI